MSLILYPSTERTFSNNGIGILSDAIVCDISSELNGIDELTMQYPVDGIHANQIDLRSIILAPRNHADQPQPYRIYDISEPMNGIVTISARHISYDLLGIPVQPYSAQNITQALAGLSQYAATECPFTFSTERTTEALFSVSVPSVIRSLLGGQQGSLLDVYGGEYEFDRFSVILHTKRGQNRGVTIRYGKNLTDIQQDKNCESVYTGVYPYWVGSDGTLVMLSEKILSASGTYDFENILPLDLSTEWEERPTETQLRTRANRYMTDNQIGSPTVSMTVSFVQLADTEEYKDAAELEQVELGDTVTIYFPRLRTESIARVVAMEYDAILNRYISITLGTVRSNIADTIVEQKTYAVKVAELAVNGQTQSDIFNKLTNNGKVQGIYIQDDNWYINAAYAKILNLVAEKLLTKKDNSSIEVDEATLKMIIDGYTSLEVVSTTVGAQIKMDGPLEGEQISGLTRIYPGQMWIGDGEKVDRINMSGSDGIIIAEEIKQNKITPNSDADFAWQYSSILGKTILVKTT